MTIDWEVAHKSPTSWALQGHSTAPKEITVQLYSTESMNRIRSNGRVKSYLVEVVITAWK